jgi:hypothetical protein
VPWTGLFGLLGVVVGGVVTAGVEVFVRRREENRQHLLAARVMHSEFVGVRSHLVAVMRAGGDFVGTLPDDVSVTCREHRTALGSLTWDQWRHVEKAVYGAKSVPWGPVLPDVWEAAAARNHEQLLVDIEEALGVLSAVHK